MKKFHTIINFDEGAGGNFIASCIVHNLYQHTDPEILRNTVNNEYGVDITYVYRKNRTYTNRQRVCIGHFNTTTEPMSAKHVYYIGGDYFTKLLFTLKRAFNNNFNHGVLIHVYRDLLENLPNTVHIDEFMSTNVHWAFEHPDLQTNNLALPICYMFLNHVISTGIPSNYENFRVWLGSYLLQLIEPIDSSLATQHWHQSQSSCFRQFVTNISSETPPVQTNYQNVFVTRKIQIPGLLDSDIDYYTKNNIEFIDSILTNYTIPEARSKIIEKLQRYGIWPALEDSNPRPTA